MRLAPDIHAVAMWIVSGADMVLLLAVCRARSHPSAERDSGLMNP